MPSAFRATSVFGIRRIWTALLVAASLAIAVAGFGANATTAQAANTYDASGISVIGISLGDDDERYHTNGRSWR